MQPCRLRSSRWLSIASCIINAVEVSYICPPLSVIHPRHSCTSVATPNRAVDRRRSPRLSKFPASPSVRLFKFSVWKEHREHRLWWSCNSWSTYCSQLPCSLTSGLPGWTWSFKRWLERGSALYPTSSTRPSTGFHSTIRLRNTQPHKKNKATCFWKLLGWMGFKVHLDICHVYSIISGTVWSLLGHLSAHLHLCSTLSSAPNRPSASGTPSVDRQAALGKACELSGENSRVDIDCHVWRPMGRVRQHWITTMNMKPMTANLREKSHCGWVFSHIASPN